MRAFFIYQIYFEKLGEKKTGIYTYIARFIVPFHYSVCTVHARCGITVRNYETGYISNPFLICCQPLQTEFETFLNLIIF